MRYAIDLIDAIALVDGTRRLREVLMDSIVPADTLMMSEARLTELLSEYLAPADVQTVMQAVKTTVRID